MELNKLNINYPFKLEKGFELPELQIVYHTYGKLNAEKSNVIWVCHALTANSNPVEWWPELIGDGFFFNPDEHFIICANVLGSCYGTTGPLSLNPVTEKPYFNDFGEVTIRDMVALHILLANHLGIDEIHTLIGGSLGGQQALEWAIIEPDRIKNLILLATNAFHSPWGIAFNEAQRLALRSDKTFYNREPSGGKDGLKAARAIALLSYRTYSAYCQTQEETDTNKTDDFKASSYQRYQGEKLINRFNAHSYYCLSKTMDSHNVGRNRKSMVDALQSIKANTLVIAIESDILFPKGEQEFLAQHINKAQFACINSFFGHDGFLIETKAISKELKLFYKAGFRKKIKDPYL